MFSPKKISLSAEYFPCENLCKKTTLQHTRVVEELSQKIERVQLV